MDVEKKPYEPPKLTAYEVGDDIEENAARRQLRSPELQTHPCPFACGRETFISEETKTVHHEAPACERWHELVATRNAFPDGAFCGVESEGG